MRTKLTFWGSMLFLLSISILLTVYLAWIFYLMEIQWLNLADRVYLKPETIQYNFHILMNYLTNPFSQVLEMPDFRSSAAGLHHFAVVKNLFHFVQLVTLVTLPSFYFFVKKIVKKGFLALYRKSILGGHLAGRLFGDHEEQDRADPQGDVGAQVGALAGRDPGRSEHEREVV